MTETETIGVAPATMTQQPRRSHVRLVDVAILRRLEDLLEPRDLGLESINYFGGDSCHLTSPSLALVQVPDDELLCEAVLANGEFFGLLQHYVGHGDAEVMAAFDQVAKAKGKKRATAIAGVSAMAAAGRLMLVGER